MKQVEKFIVLSNSKLTGKTTCKYLNGDKYVITKKNMSYFLDAMTDKNLSYYIEAIEKNKIEVFEPNLDHIFNPPLYLYKKGGGDLMRPSVAIIGSRNCSDYGRKLAYKIAYDLAKADVQVISGLAYGVDIQAHKGCLDGGGSTVAVLGSGILNCYPSKHFEIYKKIQERGLIISEYGLHAKPLKHHFPFRNRLISAFADVLIVVEAKEKSGTMITVNYALDQGKTVFAVPGPIDSIYSKGTNQLIRQGARVYLTVDDILDCLY